MNPFVQEIVKLISNLTNLPSTKIAKLITTPPNEQLGDYAFPCFVLAKRLKKTPNEIARELAEKISQTVGQSNSPTVMGAQSVGPYLNFFVNKAKLVQYTLEQILTQEKQYGKGTDGNGKTIVIDFSSPNIAKPFSIAHLRSTAIGNALKNIYKALGYRVIGVNHLGDWGTPQGKMIVAYKRWGINHAAVPPIYELFRLYVRFEEEAEKNPALLDEARAAFKRLEAGDSEALELWQWFVSESLKAFERYYKALGVEFDEIRGESVYRDQTDALIAELIKKGIARESQGAIVVPFEDERLPPLILRKRDGATTYETRDLCAAIYHYEKYHFDKKLYVVDAGQALHFRQLFKTLERMGYEWAQNLIHVPFGVLLFEDERMSTRRGKVVFLEEVLNQSIARVSKIIETIKKTAEPAEAEKKEVARDVGISAVIYADLSRSRTHDINFRWEDVLNFNGKSGPYIQYTHARLAGVLRRYGRQIPRESEMSFKLLSHPTEVSLIKRLEQFPLKVKEAAEQYEPFVISDYLGDLAVVANQFYDSCRVLGEEASLEQARLALVYATKVVLKNGLELLGMKAPERM